MAADASTLPVSRPAYRKYLNILRVSLIERLTYRGDFLLGTILRFLPMVTTILLWNAIFEGSGTDTLGDFTYREMISYLLLVHVSRMFSSMPGLAAGITRDIRDGTLKKYLLQPIDMIAYLLSYRMAHKAAYITTSAIPYGILFLACYKYFPGWPGPANFAAYIAALLMGFLVGFFMEACIGMIGFWFLEVTSLLYVINTMSFIVSGHMFPLDLMPGSLPAILKALPFAYLAYFPAAVFLGKIEGSDLVWGLVIQVAWVVAFVVMTRVLFKAGLRRYSAYGG
jgi:ABC-2 type transport system permease protein